MKKIMIIAGVLLAAVVALGAVGLANAQSQTPQPGSPVAPNSAATGVVGGPMGGMRGFRGQATSNGEYGPLHTYMIDALAQAFNLTPEQLEAIHDSGSTLWAYEQEQGMSAEQFQELMSQARSTALEQAVAAGAISQAQADWMLSRWSNMWAQGYGPGSANCDGTGHGRASLGSAGGRAGMGGRGGRWSTATTSQP